MDPQTTLYEALEMLEVGDKYAAIDAMKELVEWLEKGGFCPVVDSAEREVVTEAGIEKSLIWIVPRVSSPSR